METPSLVREEIISKKVVKDFIFEVGGEEYTATKMWFSDDLDGDDFSSEFDTHTQEWYDALSDEEQIEVDDFIFDLR